MMLGTRWEVRRRGEERFISVLQWESLTTWLEDLPEDQRDEYEWDLAPACRCCGEELIYAEGERPSSRQHWRCERHKGRNPCAIDDCTKTHAAPTSGELADHDWMCPVHWRRYVPPHSARRRAYHAFWRKAQKEGWHPDLRRRFWRFWEALVRSARAKHSAGGVDMAEINRIMGW